MNLLFLLSAILSALTGVGQAVRGDQARTVVCAAVAAEKVAPARVVAVPARPQASWPHRATAIFAAAFRLPAAEPVFAGRRRI